MSDRNDIDGLRTPLLRELARLWTARCQGDSLPTRKSFSDDDLRPFFGYLFIADILPEPPYCRYRLYGEKLVTAAGREYTGKPVDFDTVAYGPDLVVDYYRVARIRRPIAGLRQYEPAPEAFMDHWREYERLLLPLANKGLDVDQIIGGCYPLAQPVQLTA